MTLAKTTRFWMRTLRLGVKGSGSLMFLGKADRMRFLIWMQFGGMTSQKPGEVGNRWLLCTGIREVIEGVSAVIEGVDGDKKNYCTGEYKYKNKYKY